MGIFKDKQPNIVNSHLTAEALLLKDQLACSTPDIFSELIINYYIKHGYTNYDESVTQIDHSLQTANLASLDNAGNEMIVTALLHDMGHILIDEFNGKKDFLNEDRLHEFVGANFLSDYFPLSIIEPIKLHVPAKRYLCTKYESYYRSLSTASQRSFELQGGKMNINELEILEKNKYLEPAIKLREWDDLAKIKDLKVKDINEYKSCIEITLLNTSNN